MPGFRVLFRCIGEAVIAQGLRGLMGLAPFGDRLYDIGAYAYDRYRSLCREQEMQAEVQGAAQAALADVKAEVYAVVEELRATATPNAQVELAKPEVCEALASYLTQIPSSIRQSLRRPCDPSGSTLPPGFSLREPADMLKLLPARPARFKSGDQPVGNWVLTELLGTGGFGEVWKAEHCALNGIPPVALKFCLDADAARSLRHEAALLSLAMQQSQQPGIVPLRNAWLDSEPICLEYEYVNGGDLCALLAEWQQLPPERRISQAALVIQRLATTIGHFHRLNPSIVHRDLKPANILLHRTGKKVELKIADFGIGGLSAKHDISRHLRGISRGDLLASTLRGTHTPLYASPQQARGDPPAPRDDVHALGVIWYQLLIGSLQEGPGSDYADELLERKVPEDMVRLLGQCIASKPERRLADGDELAKQLRKLLNEPPATPPTVQGSSVPPGLRPHVALNSPAASPPTQRSSDSGPKAIPTQAPPEPCSDGGLQDDMRECMQLIRVGKSSKEFIEQAASSRLDAWLAAAKSGSPDGQWLVGRCCVEGIGLTQDYAEAVRWYRKAAVQGHTLAQCSLGAMYYEGEGVRQDDAEAVRWYRKAAEQGDAQAQTYLGYMYLNGRGVRQDHTEAARWYRKAAEQGLATAQCSLGCAYYHGEGVRQDYAESARWYRKAAEQGDAQAQHNLGCAYDNGEGVRQDYAEAARWYRKAAEQGNFCAQHNLGIMYTFGHGVRQDYAEAARWYRKAAEQGAARAQYSLGVSYYKGSGVSQDQTEAARWYHKAAQQGLAEAQYGLACMYYEGRGVRQDSVEAVRWYRKAAQQGDAKARHALKRLTE